jgi:hypothetical protein
MTRTGCGPLDIWRQARRSCQPGCFAYHASWPLVRAAGLKASPRWHSDFYRTQLAKAGLLQPNGPLRVLIAGAADHTVLQVLTQLVDPTRLHVTLVDRCATPLKVATRWATRHDVTLNTHNGEIQHLPAPHTAYDVALTDGLLSLLPSAEQRHQALDQLASAIAPDGLFLYTTRLTVSARPLEYDLLGRILQSLAATTWPHDSPTRAQLAVDRWHRPARSTPYATAQQLHDDLSTHFTHVHITTNDQPANTAQRLHPNRQRGIPSTILRAVAGQPKADQP